MSDDNREAIQLRERARAAARGVFLGELAELGRERKEALQRADELLDRIARVLPDALESGIQLTEIGQVTGVSRPTLYQLKVRYEERPHPNLAVIAALANGSRLDVDLVEAIGQPLDDVLAQLERAGVIRSVVIDIDDPDDGSYAGSASLYSLTHQGVAVLEAWTFGPPEPDDAYLEAEARAEAEAEEGPD